MNGLVTALQRVGVAGAVTAVLWGIGAVGLPLAQAGASRPAGSSAARPAPAVWARAAIVGGQGASIAEFPFQVALYDPDLGPPEKSFFCGGVILSATRVATAAHCLLGEGGQHSSAGEIDVLAGSSTLDPVEPGGVSDSVATVTVDPAYRSASSDYDVGLLTLAQPLWSGAAPPLDGHSTIAPLAPDVPLAEARSAGALAGLASSPVEATVSGWGEENAEPGAATVYPLRLRKVRVPLVPSALCTEEYAAIEQPITPRMLCAGGDPPGSPVRGDSCYGDSGGPLVSTAPGATAPAGDVLLGLVDFGDGCAQAGYPGVYQRTADPAIAAFLGAGSARAAVGGVNRGLCARPVRRKHRHRRPSRRAGRCGV